MKLKGVEVVSFKYTERIKSLKACVKKECYWISYLFRIAHSHQLSSQLGLQKTMNANSTDKCIKLKISNTEQDIKLTDLIVF